MTRGATLGLDAQKLAQEGRIAAAQLLADQAAKSGSLGLGYANLAAEKERNQAASDLAATKLSLEGNRLDSLNDYRTRENDLREKSLDAKSAAAALQTGRPLHVGNSLLTIDADGKPKVLFSSDATPEEKRAAEGEAAAVLLELSNANDRSTALSILGQHPKALPSLKAYGAGLLPARPVEPKISVPVPGGNRFAQPTHVSGPISAVLPIVGTNAPASIRLPTSSVAPTNPAQMLAPGTIIDDIDGQYRFKGGDPKKQESWELIK